MSFAPRRRRAACGASRPTRIDVPVEIVFKPTPVYTEEARALKLEGDVLLDVEFAASGAVTVLQVVRGLGHGLDEAATRAATQIRFKPAQSGGRPVDVPDDRPHRVSLGVTIDGSFWTRHGALKCVLLRPAFVVAGLLRVAPRRARAAAAPQSSSPGSAR